MLPCPWLMLKSAGRVWGSGFLSFPALPKAQAEIRVQGPNGTSKDSVEEAGLGTKAILGMYVGQPETSGPCWPRPQLHLTPSPIPQVTTTSLRLVTERDASPSQKGTCQQAYVHPSSFLCVCLCVCLYLCV